MSEKQSLLDQIDDFVTFGGEEQNKKELNERKSGLNTNRFITPGKEFLDIVPLVKYNAAFKGDHDTMVMVQMNTMWFDNEDVARKRKTFPDLHIPGAMDIPVISKDPDIDVGVWIKENSDTAFKFMDVKGSSKFKADPANPMTTRTMHYLPCLWLNDPSLEGKAPTEVKILKFYQVSIRKGIEEIEKMFASVGGIKGRLIRVGVYNKADRKYPVGNMEIYEHKDSMPKVDVNIFEYAGFLPRDERVNQLLNAYNIIVPRTAEIADEEKQKRIANIDKLIIDVNAEIQERKDNDKTVVNEEVPQ